MTKTEAIERIESHVQYYVPIEDLPALEMALDALRNQVDTENLWHDAKTNPPKTPGLYYGKKRRHKLNVALQIQGWYMDA